MRLATLNVYWYGLDPAVAAADGLDVHFMHGPEDDARVRALIAAVGADVFAFEEVVDVVRFEALLAALPTPLVARDAGGEAVASAAPGLTPDSRQRVVLAWNPATVQLKAWGRPLAIGPRAPVAGRFVVPSGVELTVVAVHPKSGLPRGWEHLPHDHTWYRAGLARTSFFDTLAAWLLHPSSPFEGAPPALVGDFNTVRGGPDSAALRTPAFEGWSWREPEFQPPAQARRTTRTDPEIIDHIVLSGALEAARAGEVGAWPFDEDPAVPTPLPASPEVWKRTTDHRPVWVDLGV